MLSQAGYITGVAFACDVMMSIGRLRLTLRGLEYLEENSLMERAYRAAKGIKDLIP